MSIKRNDPPALQQLHDAVDPRQKVDALTNFGLSEQDLADAAGAHRRTVRRWKSAEAGNDPTHHARQIDDLRTVVARLASSGAMTDRAVVFWMRSRNRWLGDQRPLNVLSSGEEIDFERVKAAADLFVNPHAHVPVGLLTIVDHPHE